MKELTRLYGDLLQDKRVRSEQAKYDGFTRQRNHLLSRYRKIFQAFNDLIAGLMRAQSFYTEMRDTVESLDKNVVAFVNNRREEGAELLSQIEAAKQSKAGGQADREREQLESLMSRMAINPAPPTRSKSSASRPQASSRPSQNGFAYNYQPSSSPPYTMPILQAHNSSSPAPSSGPPSQGYSSHPNGHYQDPRRDAYLAGYDPMQYPYQPRSPPANQIYPPNPGYPYAQQLPPGFVPPPPPPGPPPGTQGYSYGQLPGRQGAGTPGSGDPWAGLSAWK